MFKHTKRISKKLCSVAVEAEKIPFTLKRSSRRRTIAITIDAKAEVCVAAPFYTSENEVVAFIHEKGAWIVDKLKEARRNQAFLDQKQFDHGQEFLFLGKKHQLNFIDRDIKRCKVDFDGLRWEVHIPLDLGEEGRQKAVREKVTQWYRAQAKEILGGRVFHFGRVLGKEPKGIVVKTQKRMWGCCNYNTQVIYLNWQIILSPLKVIDYVVVHELCHLFEPNHSKRFWNKVAKVLPDYKERRRWLKINFMEMTLP